ncbi:MAG: F0F1 ATP synthase subunit A [Lachnospiraceae bacterium]|nr:F0F1 ATP synthase subunit A [Lachnospiraceae bacterium]
MDKKKRTRFLIVIAIILAALLVGVFLTADPLKEEEPIRIVMKDAVLHEEAQVNFLGIRPVNPAVISAYTVTAIIFVFALFTRLFVIPKFKHNPGRFQLLCEQAVGLFDGLATSNSPHRHNFLGAYVFTAGTYIFIGTMFELLGVMAPTTAGGHIALPAPLADINGAISMGVFSYCVILSGGIAGNKVKGVLNTLKDFSLPISMSFRLFGALLSGALVTELVYYYITTSFVIPVFVAVMFTMLHALIQAYVLTMLTALFYGEVSETHTEASSEEQ